MLKKYVSLVVALVMVFGAFGVANAQTPTIESLQAMIAQLTAQLATLSGTTATTVTTTAGTSFTLTLSVGSRNVEVTALQNFLNTNIAAGLPVTGYYGAMTKAAVIRFQTANGISGTGTVGPITRARLNELTTPVVVPPTTTTTTTTTTTSDTTDGVTTTGVEGDMATKVLSSPSNAKLSQGESDLKVMGFSVEADDSDIALKTADVTFLAQATVLNSRPWNYFKTVKLYAGDTMLAEVNADSKDDWKDVDTDGYSVRFTNLNSVVKEGEKDNYYVVVDAVNTIDSSDVSQTWKVSVLADDLRAVDGAGLSVYNDAVTRNFLVENANTGTLTIKSNSNTPEASTVEVSSTTDTTKIPLLTFGVKATDSNVDLTEMVIDIASTTDVADMGSVIGNVELYHGSTLVGSEDVGVDGLGITFDLSDEGITIDVDQTEVFTVKVDVNELTGTDFVAGTAVKASAASVTGDDSVGDEVTDASGVDGYEIAFSTSAASVTTSWSAVPSVGNLLDFNFIVTAGDEDYTVLLSGISSSTDVTGGATIGKGVLSKIAGTATTVTAGEEYTVQSGDKATFQVRYPVTGNNGTYGNVTVTSVAGQTVPDDKQVSPTVTRNLAT